MKIDGRLQIFDEAARQSSLTHPRCCTADRPVRDARVSQAIGQSFDWLVPAEAEVFGARIADRPAAFPLAELEQRASASVVDRDVFSRRLRPRERRSAILLSLIRAKSLPGAAPQAPGHAHGITLSFHREMADASRKLVGPDVTAAVSFESYPRFIKGGFQDYECLGIKSSTDNSTHVPSPRSRLLGTTPFGVSPTK
jgi:hypothetical protein